MTGAPKSFSVRDAPSASFTRSSMIPVNMVTVQSPLLVPMITVAKVVNEHAFAQLLYDGTFAAFP